MKSKEENQLQRSAEDKVSTSYAFYTIILVPICMCKAMLSSMAVRLHRGYAKAIQLCKAMLIVKIKLSSSAKKEKHM